MAVSLPSDIVMDVAKAVDPSALRDARAELVRKAGASPAKPFSETLGSSTASVADFATPAAGAARQAAAPKSEDTYKKFEATVLQTFIQSMLPKNTEDVYGKGLSGDMWKQLLSGKLADAMEARGGIGIASKLLSEHYKKGEEVKPLGPISSRGPERSEIDTQKGLSSAMLDELQRKAMTKLGIGAPSKSDKT